MECGSLEGLLFVCLVGFSPTPIQELTVVGKERQETKESCITGYKFWEEIGSEEIIGKVSRGVFKR